MKKNNYKEDEEDEEGEENDNNEEIYFDNNSENDIKDLSFKKQTLLKSLSNPNNNEKSSNRLDDLNEASFHDYLEQYNPLPRKYIREMHEDNENKFDHKYGFRHDPIQEKFYIGNSEINIDGNDIIVKGKRYKGSTGVYELLFKKQPSPIFSEHDEEIYLDILKNTNAARRFYQSNQKISGSKLEKFQKIIEPHISGKGIFLEANNKNSIDYIHWDNPNELVDRLRLLLASIEAGHTGHQNEITSIIEELRESKIIA